MAHRSRIGYFRPISANLFLFFVAQNFTNLNLKTIAQWLAHGHPEIPNGIRRQLLSFVLNKNSAWLYGHDDVVLSPQQIQQLDDYQNQYLAGKPLAYMTGQQPFWDLTLKVNEHTLIPRPDTELIIETLQSLPVRPQNILDLGTGSGALALVLARLYPDSDVTATDTSSEALKVAAHNAERYGLNHITFLNSHWFSALENVQFDLIVSNPPYIAPGDRHLKALKHEPVTALVADQNGLSDLKIIIKQARQFLNPNGLLMVEHGYNQHHVVSEHFAQNQYIPIKTLYDIEQRPRATMAYLN